MKKLLICIALASFTFALQAGENKTCTAKDKAACCTTKTSTSTTSTSCCSGKEMTSMKGHCTKQVVLMSPKGAEQTSRMVLASR
jgi:hypothetical protein